VHSINVKISLIIKELCPIDIGDEFISDLIDRGLANPFPGRFLSIRNLFREGQNLPEIDGFNFYFYLNCGGFWGVN
jgi:hypothetical protein